MKTLWCSFLPLFTSILACNPSEPRSPMVSQEPPRVSPSSGASASSSQIEPSKSPSDEPAASSEPSLRPLDIPFHHLVTKLSEKNAYYFSDNYVSNETAFLQVAPQLPTLVKPGGAYIGVGPEQNFSYIAMTKPDIAFILDIRRKNMLLHLLYKAIFEEATSRSHFLSLLLGRTYQQEGDPGETGRIEAVLEHATTGSRSREVFRTIHARLMEQIINNYGFQLSVPDRAALREAHQQFHEKQLDITFELHMATKRKYPTLHALMTIRDPSGEQSAFLANERSFRLLKQMQEENRIVPVVGDFGGEKALRSIGAYLQKQDLRLSVFYTSNVEEYLLQDNKWGQWIDNLDSLPFDEQSLFLRSYLARAGRTHPLQEEGHWSTVFLQRIKDFRDRQQQAPFNKWHDVATHGLLMP